MLAYSSNGLLHRPSEAGRHAIEAVLDRREPSVVDKEINAWRPKSGIS